MKFVMEDRIKKVFLTSSLIIRSKYPCYTVVAFGDCLFQRYG